MQIGSFPVVSSAHKSSLPSITCTHSPLSLSLASDPRIKAPSATKTILLLQKEAHQAIAIRASSEDSLGLELDPSTITMDANKIRDPLLATVAKETIPAAVRRARGWALFTAAGTLLSFAVGHAVAYVFGQFQVCSTQVGVRNYTRLAGFWAFRIFDRCGWIHPSWMDWLGVVFDPMHASFVLRCVQWTDAQFADDSALWFGMLSCALLQAAVAALALQLPCCRSWVRRALAYLALLVTLVGHCMYAAAVRLLLAADPGFLVARIFCTANMVIFAGGDLFCFLGLLLGGED